MRKIRGHGALALAEREAPSERDAVERVADVEKQRREHDLETGGARREEADGAELGAPGKDEEGEGLCLDEGEPGAAGGDRVGDGEGGDPEPERREGQEATPEGAVSLRCPHRPILFPTRAGRKVKRPRLRLPGAFQMGVPRGGDSWSS